MQARSCPKALVDTLGLNLYLWLSLFVAGCTRGPGYPGCWYPWLSVLVAGWAGHPPSMTPHMSRVWGADCPLTICAKSLGTGERNGVHEIAPQKSYQTRLILPLPCGTGGWSRSVFPNVVARSVAPNVAETSVPPNFDVTACWPRSSAGGPSVH